MPLTTEARRTGRPLRLACGMMAVKTSMHANHLLDNLHGIRTAIE
jgi:hypothetical protein